MAAVVQCQMPHLLSQLCSKQSPELPCLVPPQEELGCAWFFGKLIFTSGLVEGKRCCGVHIEIVDS